MSNESCPKCGREIERSQRVDRRDDGGDRGTFYFHDEDDMCVVRDD